MSCIRISRCQDKKMNEFSYVDGTFPEFRSQILFWDNKCIEYISIFYDGNTDNIVNTLFGDCFAKARELAFSVEDDISFRGVVDEEGRVQSAAIISEGYVDTDFTSKPTIIIDTLTNAPWNVIDKITPENMYKRKGAATSLIEGIIKESLSKGFEGVVKALAIPRAVEFYLNLGFIENDSSAREVIVPSYLAQNILDDIELKRQLQIFD